MGRANPYIRKQDRNTLFRLLKRNTFKSRPQQNNATALSNRLEWDYTKVQRVVYSLIRSGDVEMINAIIYPIDK